MTRLLDDTTVDGDLAVTVTDAGTTASIPIVLALRHRTTATPGVAFGLSQKFYADTTTTEDVEVGDITFAWFDPTHASRQGIFQIDCHDSGGARSIISGGANGSAGTLSFFGATRATQRTGDVGTGLATLGLFSGTPTYAAANLTGTAPASVLPVFVQAGGSAAKGAVPAPGSSAHTNQPYVLLDTAAWGANLGGHLGSSYVGTNQTTTSGSATDLATTQHVSFTLDEAADVLIQASCVTYNPTAAAVNVLTIDVDGSDTGASYEMFGSNKQVQMVLQIKVALASGAHTIKLQFATNAGTGNFSNRTIVVWRVS
jgi:hypothetical protein